MKRSQLLGRKLKNVWPGIENRTRHDEEGLCNKMGRCPSDFLLQKYRLWSWYFILVKNRRNSGHIRRLAVDTKLVWWDDGAVHGATVTLPCVAVPQSPQTPLGPSTQRPEPSRWPYGSQRTWFRATIHKRTYFGRCICIANHAFSPILKSNFLSCVRNESVYISSQSGSIGRAKVVCRTNARTITKLKLECIITLAMGIDVLRNVRRIILR